MSNYTQFDPANPPPPLMTGEPGSFAYQTMTTRFPMIIQNVLADHAGLYPNSIVQAVQSLYDELVQNQPIRPLETAAPDGPNWAEAWQPYQGRRWLEVPWYFAEAFIYRRLMEAVGYFGESEETKRRGGEGGQGSRGAGEQGREGDTDIAGLPSLVSGRELQSQTKVKDWIGVDPFLPRKQVELQSEVTWGVLAAALSQALDGSADSFRALLHHSVWGNRADLSYTKVAETAGGRIVVSSEQANLLVDDTEAVLVYLQGSREAEEQRGMTQSPLHPRSPAPLLKIDFICDNAGTELLLDLALVYFLLRFDWTTQITLHVKAHPTYVSDATPADIELTLAAIKSQAAPEFVVLAAGLESYREQQRLRIQADIFWNSSRFFWEIPPALGAQLSQARLVIIKGDANYRRLVGDSRCWPTSIPAAQAIPYFPAPFVALRTLKSDPIVGLKPGQAEQLDQQDAEWRVNGRRGMIQFVK
jgi:uncharacterized protein with ATP-grasp and redox domains